MSRNPTARERQLLIATLVSRYQRQPNAAEHERLRLLIEEEYGSVAAEFFDEEGSLPLVGRVGPGGYPWPMREWESSYYAMGVFISACAVMGVVAWALSSVIHILPAVIIGTAAAGVVWFASSPIVGRLFPPKDLPERHRLARGLAAVQERHRRRAETAGEKARGARQFRRIVEDGEQK